MRISGTLIAPIVLAMVSVVTAETHTIVVDSTSITPAALEVAPGDTVYFDCVCATTVFTGQPCMADGIPDRSQLSAELSGFSVGDSAVRRCGDSYLRAGLQ